MSAEIKINRTRKLNSDNSPAFRQSAWSLVEVNRSVDRHLKTVRLRLRGNEE